MKSQEHKHLQEEQIIWAVIDEMELADADRQHLSTCLACRKKVDLIKEELQEFGENARRSVPPFTRTVTLPSEKPVAASGKTGWLPFFGATAMAGLVVFIYVMGMGNISPTQLTSLQNQEWLLEDEVLMQKISELVENPLYDEMYEISGENGIGFDDEFLEFVVPEIQEDFQSERNNQGGIKQC